MNNEKVYNNTWSNEDIIIHILNLQPIDCLLLKHLQSSAIKSIRITYPIEEFWKTTSREEAPYVVWRYVMTEDGVQRMYPGVRLTNDYDHKLRPW